MIYKSCQLFVVIGICDDLPAGNYSITLTSFISIPQSSMHVGFGTHASRFYVEELGQTTRSAGNGLDFNLHVCVTYTQ